jgi:signal transduction histidine kinase
LIEDYPDLLPPEGQEDLLRVKDEALRMGTLIEDLLRLSRLGKQEMSIEEVDLTSLVRSILLAFAGQEPARRAQFVLDPDLRIHGDPVLIPILFG